MIRGEEVSMFRVKGRKGSKTESKWWARRE